jgi:selenocysteine lyase/cysteine desulfurase
MHEIPVIDIGPASSRADTLHQIEEACRDIGFMFIRGHGISQQLIESADEASWTGIGSFRLRGQTSFDDAQQLQQALENKFGIFTVVRKGLNSGGCVRITPQVFNSADDIGRLVEAMGRLAT